jgi:hypothetical protein
VRGDGRIFLSTPFKECVFTVSATNSKRVYQDIFRAPHPILIIIFGAYNIKLPVGAFGRPCCLRNSGEGAFFLRCFIPNARIFFISIFWA